MSEEQVPNTPIHRAIKWSLGDDTGISSKALCAVMLGFEPILNIPPSDKWDRGRCIRLLKLIPEWIPRLKEMAEYEAYTVFTADKEGIKHKTNGWAEQITPIS